MCGEPIIIIIIIIIIISGDAHFSANMGGSCHTDSSILTERIDPAAGSVVVAATYL
jgi:hypothetical protein